MTNKSLFDCQENFMQAYQEARSYHGELDLGYDGYENCLYPIIHKYLGANPRKFFILKFLSELHTNDLYLTIACARKGEAAWQQFDKLFGGYLFDLAKRESANVEAAKELADSVFTDLFFDDRAQRPRIASYEGQCSLAHWLRVVIAHRACDERERKCNRLESLEFSPDPIDENSLQRIELPFRANQYRSIVLETFKGASSSLTKHEQFILLMRYGYRLKEHEIGRAIGVHQTTVARQLQRIYQKMKQEMMMILANTYQLSPQAIEECIADILENSEHSLLECIKESSEKHLTSQPR